MAVPRLLVVGGNGFLVCKAAVAKGWHVSSASSSGKPYASPAGHAPKWVDRVEWHKASAFEPESYSALVASSCAVVHTLGILLEDVGYKAAVRSGDIGGVVRALASSWGSPNPLRTKEEKQRGYEGMNRDSVLDTALANPGPSRFVYVSAADAFSPVVPARYIETKREAEAAILQRCANSPVHPTIVRPGLMYHSHTRPLSTLPAFMLSLTAAAHDRLQLPSPFASKSALGKASEALRTHPLHVDHVAEAIVRCIETDVDGMVDVQAMREWAGFAGKSSSGAAAHA